MPLKRRADTVALIVFGLVLIVAMWQRWHYDDWLTEYDIFTYFLPWFTMVGESIRHASLPGWTPTYLAGTTLAGDPSAGWMYLPVMIPFALLHTLTAMKVMIVAQVAIAGLATYALSRVLGLEPLAALTSTAAFAFGPYLSGQTIYTTIGGQVETWIPVALLATELSLRSSRWINRCAWYSLGALAVSQLSVAWPGQGMFDAVLLVAAWIAYRGLGNTAAPQHIRERFLRTIALGAGVIGGGVALGAAGILPRLDANAQSSIPNGDYSKVMGGEYNPAQNVLGLLRQIMTDQAAWRPTLLGGSVIILALLAIVIAPRRKAVLFFAAVWFCSNILALHTTPLHRLFYLIPLFEKLHEHSAARITWITTLAPAMLTGMAVQALLDGALHHRQWRLWLPSALFLAADAYIVSHGRSIGVLPVAMAVITTLIVAVFAIPTRFGSEAVASRAPRIVASALLLTVIAFPFGDDLVHSLAGGRPSSEGLATTPTIQAALKTSFSSTDPGGAGEFLQALQRTSPPFRIVSYAGRDPAPNRPSYSTLRLSPGVLAVLLNGRTEALGLESIQGYNPNHFLDFDEYVRAMNGGPQDYHWSDPYPGALTGNQLLDMLNVRYILVDATIPTTDPTIQRIAETQDPVYQNPSVVIYENPDAFDRAWAVHDVRKETPSSLQDLRSGTLNGRTVAVVDGAVPTVVQPVTSDPPETVAITSATDNAITAKATLSAQGLVVFSEIYAKGWKAYVDGRQTEILRTDHTFRGVVVPRGAHIVELTFDPRSLHIGIAITSTTALVMLIVTGVAVAGWWQERRRPLATASETEGPGEAGEIAPVPADTA